MDYKNRQFAAKTMEAFKKTSQNFKLGRTAGELVKGNQIGEMLCTYHHPQNQHQQVLLHHQEYLPRN